MKSILFASLILFLFHISKGQKPPLELDSYQSWPYVNEGTLSNNGKFAFYQIHNYPIHKTNLVVQETEGNWKVEIQEIENINFSRDSRKLYGRLSKDTLLVLDLVKKLSKKIEGVENYALLENELWTSLLYKDTQGNLLLCNMDGEVKFSFPNIKQYTTSSNGKALIIQQLISEKSKSENINVIDVTTGKKQLIYEGKGASDFIFDNSAKQLGFIVSNGQQTSIWYYKFGTGSAIEIGNNKSVGIDSSLTITIGQFWQFSNDGNRIFFSLAEKPKRKLKKENKDLEIWNYQDAYLKSYYYGNNIGGPMILRQYLSVIQIQDGRIIQLLHNLEEVVGGGFKKETDSILLTQSSFGPINEQWNQEAHISYFLTFTKTGKSIPIELNRKTPLNCLQISPNGKYVFYFDPTLESYCSYLLLNGDKNILTEKISSKSFVRDNLQNYPWPENFALGIVGWLKDDESVIVQGTYDLWKLNPLNKQSPVNLTKGVGQKNRTVFYLAGEPIGETIGKDGKLLLSAFNLNTKDYGFYSLSLKGQEDLQKLSMSAHYSNDLEGVYTQLSPYDFVKSKNASAYLIRLESSNKAPNYFFSFDLKAFKALTDFQPQREYNWLTSELHTYEDSLGNKYQGVLYKPEDFNPNNSYPIIFNIYEEKSNLLNSFPSAEVSMGEIDIAYLVSNGYLVFLPDIKKNDPGFPGDDVLRSVIAGVDHLCKFPWINPLKIGLAGGSTGGWEANYIVTHTNRFAAVISGAGMSDLIRLSTELRYGNSSINSMATNMGYIMGGTLPDNPESYIRNSPILFAKKVKTPLLLLHNNADDAVNYNHSQSFFIVLRALQKQVWWLNYRGEGHGLWKTENRLDYHKRATEFWDYFLKGKPEPEWMQKHLSVTNR